VKQLLYLPIILIIGSCNQEPKSSVLDKEDVTAQIELMLTNYHTAINKDGLTAEFFYLDRSPDFYWVPPGYESALNYDSVRTILVQNSKSLKEIKLQWDTLKIFPLTNNIATYTGIVNIISVDTADVESNVSIIESGTLIKRENRWKLLNGQSAILNAETNRSLIQD